MTLISYGFFVFSLFLSVLSDFLFSPYYLYQNYFNAVKSWIIV